MALMLDIFVLTCIIILMIKKVTLIKKIKDKYPINVDLLKVEPPLKMETLPTGAEYLIGGFYLTAGYNIFAFYACDEDGNILSDEPVLHDEGFNSYQEIFERLGYTFI